MDEDNENVPVYVVTAIMPPSCFIFSFSFEGGGGEFILFGDKTGPPTSVVFATTVLPIRCPIPSFSFGMYPGSCDFAVHHGHFSRGGSSSSAFARTSGGFFFQQKGGRRYRLLSLVFTARRIFPYLLVFGLCSVCFRGRNTASSRC